MSGLFGSTLIKGTKITDFSGTSAEVGRAIPFGHGAFPVDGFIGWAPLPPVEHRQVKRQGKGGVKQETFTYTLSYGVWFCKGTIYGVKWIKRNGKVVYTTDPNAPLEDREYAAKWAQRVNFHWGTRDQLPDSLIESYEGVGNVSGFPDSFYFTIEDEDVTDNGGAPPNYEACVIATPPEAYLTSHPYTQYFADDTQTKPLFGEASTRRLLIIHDVEPENVSIDRQFYGASTREAQWAWTQEPERGELAPLFFEASSRNALVSHTQPPEDFAASEPVFVSAMTKDVLLTNEMQDEFITTQPLFIGASTS